MKFTTNKIILTAIILFISCIIYVSVLKQDDQVRNIHIETFKVGSGWGFDLYKDEKIIIHQEHIPAINSYKNFSNEKDARKLAELMKNKMNNGIFPPSISLKEIDSLNINLQ